MLFLCDSCVLEETLLKNNYFIQRWTLWVCLLVFHLVDDSKKHDSKNNYLHIKGLIVFFCANAVWVEHGMTATDGFWENNAYIFDYNKVLNLAHKIIASLSYRTHEELLLFYRPTLMIIHIWKANFQVNNPISLNANLHLKCQCEVCKAVWKPIISPGELA